MNIKTNLGTLKEVIERITGRDLETEKKYHEDVIARSMFYGIGNDLFGYKDTQLAEFIGKKRLSSYHCRKKIYDRFKDYDKPNWILRNYIVSELDRELGTKNESYLRSNLREVSDKLDKLTPEVAENALEKINRILTAYVKWYGKDEE